MTLDDWYLAGRNFSQDGHTIFYRDESPADVDAPEVVVCIHGFPTASWDWHRVWPTLAGRFRAIAPDMLGFGFSEKPKRYAYAISKQATLHEELLASLGITRVHVLAHDYGDTVAQELLARDLERKRRKSAGLDIRSVCLLNGGLFPETHRARPIQRLLLSPAGPLLSRLMRRATFARSFSAVFGPRTQPTEAELDAFWRLISHNDGTAIAHKLLGYMPERRRYRDRWVGALVETDVPLRLVNGPLDPVSGLHMTQRYRELVPKPDVVLLPGIGHYPQVEDPDGVLSAYLDFVGRHTDVAA